MDEPKPKRNDPVIKIGSNNAALSTIALMLMLGSILFPAINNAMHLEGAKPAQLLVSICVSLFASVIYLWILDATNVLPFRKEWVGKAIYGAAITSVLGTSVGVYKDYFQADKYPLRGKWNATITSKVNNYIIANNELNLSFSENSQAYYGYSDIKAAAITDSSKTKYHMALAIDLQHLDPDKKFALLKIVNQDGRTILYKGTMLACTDKAIEVQLDSTTILNLIRPN